MDEPSFPVVPPAVVPPAPDSSPSGDAATNPLAANAGIGPVPPMAGGQTVSGRLAVLLALLAVVLAIPYAVERVQYSMTRGRLRAEYEVAGAELARVDGVGSVAESEAMSHAFRLVAQRVSPSVVRIETEQRRLALAEEEDSTGDAPRGMLSHSTRGQGSGVVVNESGYILTNHHVVSGADRVNVVLADGRVYEGVDLVGYDPQRDLALLKIEASGLISIDWGESDALEVGDCVLAIGNPFGLDRTVTMGIVSAKHRRHIGHFSEHQDLIQTDVAVNPGNSGGPLVNLRGQLVGINTAIVGQANRGISFSVSGDVAHMVYEQLRANGEVANAWLGVEPADLSMEEARRLELDVPPIVGARVNAIVPRSPAAEAEFEIDDVIIAWDGNPVEDAADLRRLVAATPVGSLAKVVMVRQGKRLELELRVTRRPDELMPRR